MSYCSISVATYHDQKHCKVEFVLVCGSVGLDFHNDRQHMQQKQEAEKSHLSYTVESEAVNWKRGKAINSGNLFPVTYFLQQASLSLESSPPQ